MKPLNALISAFQKADRELHVALYESVSNDDVDSRHIIDEAYSLSSLGRIRAIAAGEMKKAKFELRPLPIVADE